MGVGGHRDHGGEGSRAARGDGHGGRMMEVNGHGSHSIQVVDRALSQLSSASQPANKLLPRSKKIRIDGRADLRRCTGQARLSRGL